jgi:cytoplasmic tRNA 2-thiolation protein 2
MYTMRTVGLWGDYSLVLTYDVLCRPTQQSIQGWKARTSIHSFTDPPSPADVAASSLPVYLCYSCHTTLTSKSSRSTKSPNSSSRTTPTPLAENFPTWAAARLAFGIGDEQSAISTTSTSVNEVWATQKLDSGLMKSRVGEFLLDH